jgi:hypothetical protein
MHALLEAPLPRFRAALQQIYAFPDDHQASLVEVDKYPILRGRKVVTYPKMVIKLA